MNEWRNGDPRQRIRQRQTGHGKIRERLDRRKRAEHRRLVIERKPDRQARKPRRFPEARGLNERLRQIDVHLPRHLSGEALSLIVLAQAEVGQTGGESFAEHDEPRGVECLHKARSIQGLGWWRFYRDFLRSHPETAEEYGANIYNPRRMLPISTLPRS